MQHAGGIRPDMRGEDRGDGGRVPEGGAGAQEVQARSQRARCARPAPLVRHHRAVGLGQDDGHPELRDQDAARQGREGARRGRYAELRLVDDQRGDPARHGGAVEHGGRRSRRVAGLPRPPEGDPAEEADQRRAARRQRNRSAGDGGGDRRAGRDAARAHRRAVRPAGDGDAGLSHGDQVRSDLRVRRDVRRSQGSRARPDLGLHPAGGRRSRRPRRRVRRAFRRAGGGAGAARPRAPRRGASDRGARRDLRLLAAVRFPAPGAGRPHRRLVRSERLPGRPDHAWCLLHQRDPGRAVRSIG